MTPYKRYGILLALLLGCVLMVGTQYEHILQAWEYRKVTIPVVVCFGLYAWLTTFAKASDVGTLEEEVIRVLSLAEYRQGGLEMNQLLKTLKLKPKRLPSFQKALDQLLEEGKIQMIMHHAGRPLEVERICLVPSC